MSTKAEYEPGAPKRSRTAPTCETVASDKSREYALRRSAAARKRLLEGAVGDSEIGVFVHRFNREALARTSFERFSQKGMAVWRLNDSGQDCARIRGRGLTRSPIREPLPIEAKVRRGADLSSKLIEGDRSVCRRNGFISNCGAKVGRTEAGLTPQISRCRRLTYHFEPRRTGSRLYLIVKRVLRIVLRVLWMRQLLHGYSE